MELAMVGDEFVPLSELSAQFLDRGTFFGDGVYEVVRSYAGRIFSLDAHLDRFERSLAEIEIMDVDMAHIRCRVEDAFRRAGIANAAIYFHITRGSAVRNHTWDTGITPNFFLTITELPDSTPLKSRGVGVATFPDWRWKRCDIKSLNLLANVLAKREAERKGCFEAILVGDDGLLTEGAGSAFFAVMGNTLVTRALGPEILPSITRVFILRLLSRVGLDLVERALSPREAAQADELFLGVSTKDVVPIVTFDGKQIGSGRPGPYTGRLITEFANEVARQSG